MDQQTEAAIERAANEAARRVARETLLVLGINSEQPIETQRDMAYLRELRLMFTDPNFQKDMIHLRRWRQAMDKMETKGMMAALGMLVTGMLAIILVGFSYMTGK